MKEVRDASERAYPQVICNSRTALLQCEQPAVSEDLKGPQLAENGNSSASGDIFKIPKYL
jgi:hypothetical protein